VDVVCGTINAASQMFGAVNLYELLVLKVFDTFGKAGIQCLNFGVTKFLINFVIEETKLNLMKWLTL
jgi:hypothetical protein